MLATPAPASLLPLAQSLLRAGRVGAALRLRAARLPPGRRAVALALFRDAAQRGGSLLAPRGGDLVWIAPGAAEAAELARLCGTLFGDLAGPVELWPLPAAEAALLAWAEAAAADAAPRPAPRPAEPPLAERLAALDPAALLRRTALQSRDGRSGGWRLALPEDAVAEALGLADPDLARHAASMLAERLLAAPPVPAGEGLLLLDLPQATLPPAWPGAIGVLPAAAAAAPAGLARRRAALAERGWRLAIGPLCAPHLALLRAGAIAADFLLLAWSPALAEAAEAVASAGPSRCVLIGCDGEAAVGFGLAAGIGWFAAA